MEGRLPARHGIATPHRLDDATSSFDQGGATPHLPEPHDPNAAARPRDGQSRSRPSVRSMTEQERCCRTGAAPRQSRGKGYFCLNLAAVDTSDKARRAYRWDVIREPTRHRVALFGGKWKTTDYNASNESNMNDDTRAAPTEAPRGAALGIGMLEILRERPHD